MKTPRMPLKLKTFKSVMAINARAYLRCAHTFRPSRDNTADACIAYHQGDQIVECSPIRRLFTFGRFSFENYLLRPNFGKHYIAVKVMWQF
jgi:hypothetical protein